MRKTLLLVPILATSLLAVSACAKQGGADNTLVINETSVNETTLDTNSGTVDGFGNDTLAGNEAAPLNAADNAGNTL